MHSMQAELTKGKHIGSKLPCESSERGIRVFNGGIHTCTHLPMWTAHCPGAPAQASMQRLPNNLLQRAAARLAGCYSYGSSKKARLCCLRHEEGAGPTAGGFSPIHIPLSPLPVSLLLPPSPALSLAPTVPLLPPLFSSELVRTASQ